jgi:FKBP-type peptidyl-prolyl cis-trans isomerase FkpA
MSVNPQSKTPGTRKTRSLNRPRGVRILPCAIVFFFIIAGCQTNEPASEGPPAIDANIGTITTASGLQYQDIVVGDGGVAIPDVTISVHYSGWLTDGTKFDSSIDRDKPFVLTLGQTRVIQGWQEGLQGMKEGGKRRLIIPPTLGYGEGGFPPDIPPNATLIFDIELLEVSP